MDGKILSFKMSEYGINIDFDVVKYSDVDFSKLLKSYRFWKLAIFLKYSTLLYAEQIFSIVCLKFFVRTL